MQFPASASTYHFENSPRLIGHNRRLVIETDSGHKYNFAAEDNSKNLCSIKCIRKLFWTKVYLINTDGNKETIWINRSSLAKRTKTTSSFTDSTIKKHRMDKNFDNILAVLSKVDRIATALKPDLRYDFSCSREASKIVKMIEKNREQLWNKAIAEGSYVIEKKGYNVVVNCDRRAEKIHFYVQLSKKIGEGGFKKVYPLLDYGNEKTNLVLSVQKTDSKSSPGSERMNYPMRGFKITEKLRDEKHIIRSPLIIEKGIHRNESGVFLGASEKAEAYVVSKRCTTTFWDIVHSKRSPEVKLNLFANILEGVAAMHRNEIAHRDLKFENILIQEKAGQIKVKIIDMDLALSFDELKIVNRLQGTLAYIAPEILKKPESLSCPEKVDSWSLGIMLYQLCEGDPDFIHGLKALNSSKRYEQVVMGSQSLSFESLPEGCPLIDIIKGLLAIDPIERLSAEEARTLLIAYLAAT